MQMVLQPMQLHGKGKSKEVLYPYSVWQRKRHSSDCKEITETKPNSFCRVDLDYVLLPTS